MVIEMERLCRPGRRVAAGMWGAGEGGVGIENEAVGRVLGCDGLN